MYTHIIHCILGFQFSLSRNVCNSAEENQHDEFHLGNCFFFVLKHKICNALVWRADWFLCHIRQKLRFIYGFHADIFFPVFFAIVWTGNYRQFLIQFYLCLLHICKHARGTPLRGSLQVNHTNLCVKLCIQFLFFLCLTFIAISNLSNIYRCLKIILMILQFIFFDIV